MSFGIARGLSGVPPGVVPGWAGAAGFAADLAGAAAFSAGGVELLQELRTSATAPARNRSDDFFMGLGCGNFPDAFIVRIVNQRAETLEPPLPALPYQMPAATKG
jgi:hypothetical protein